MHNHYLMPPRCEGAFFSLEANYNRFKLCALVESQTVSLEVNSKKDAINTCTECEYQSSVLYIISQEQGQDFESFNQVRDTARSQMLCIEPIKALGTAHCFKHPNQTQVATVEVNLPPIVVVGIGFLDGCFSKREWRLYGVGTEDDVKGTVEPAAFGNVYPHSGAICWGDIEPNSISSPFDLWQKFFSTSFNEDLSACRFESGDNYAEKLKKYDHNKYIRRTQREIPTRLKTILSLADKSLAVERQGRTQAVIVTQDPDFTARLQPSSLYKKEDFIIAVGFANRGEGGWLTTFRDDVYFIKANRLTTAKSKFSYLGKKYEIF